MVLFVFDCNNHRKIIVCVTSCCHGKSESISVRMFSFFSLFDRIVALIFVAVTEFSYALRILALLQVLV